MKMNIRITYGGRREPMKVTTYTVTRAELAQLVEEWARETTKDDSFHPVLQMCRRRLEQKGWRTFTIEVKKPLTMKEAA